MKTNQIRDAIKRLASEGEEMYSIACKVKSVEGETCDCEPLNGDSDILEVSLVAGSGDQILITPVIGSTVFVSWLSKDIAFVSLFGDIKEIELKGSANGGVPVGQSISTRLNLIEADLNVLKGVFSGWVVPLSQGGPPDGGLALKTAVTSWAGKTLVPTVKTQIESTTVKHG